MKKRVLSALLALCMACTLAGNVWAAEETEPTPAPSAGVEAQTVEPQTVEPTPSAEPTQAPAPSPDATAEPEATPEPSAAPSAAPDATVAPTATPAPTEAPEATDAPAATATPDATADPAATPAPTEAPAATEAPAPSEAPSATPAPTAEAGGEPVADGVEYTAALEQDGQALNVIVTAPEGAFDAGVTPALSVTAIEDEAEGDAIAAKLDESGVTYDGFAALDISFKNEAGEEIEPKLPVTVRIELPEAIVDSGIDLNTLAVQHLAEDEAGNVTAVEQVASVADGTIALSEEAVAAMEAAEQAAEESNEAAIAPMMLAAPANDALTPDADAAEAPAVAEFEVSGFSTFTITWSYGWTTYFRVTVHYVDENGNEISGPREDGYNSNDSITNRETITFNAEYGGDIEGYTYQEAHYNSYQGNSIVKMVASSSGGWNPTYYLSFYDREDGSENNGWIARLSYDTDSLFEETKEAEIYLIYKENETPDPGPDDPGQVTQNATVTTGKTAVLRDDGNYDLTLSVSGDRGTTKQKQLVDVLFIVDRSSSMTESRQYSLNQAVGTLISTLQSDRYKDVLDVQYGVVAFAGSTYHEGWRYIDYGTTSYSWTSSGNEALKTIQDLDYDGGTNYQQAVYTGKQMLANRDSDRKESATTFVIFISDGIPTYRGVNVTNGTEEQYSNNGNGQNDDSGQNISAAVTEIGSMNCDYFYAIGMGDDFGQEWEGGHWEWQDGEQVWVPAGNVDKQGTANLKKLANAVNATYKGDDNVYSADDEDLSGAFGDITAQITFFAAKNVVMTDPLSQWADIVPTGENDQVEFTVTLEKRDVEGNYEAVGQPQTVTSGRPVEFTTTTEDEDGHTSKTRFSMTPIWNSESETIQVAFGESYELAPGYRYSVSTIITPSEDAIREGEEAYDGKGENDTGTHANDVGFWSNKNAEAKVTYTANSEPGFEPFPKPVIQVPEKKTAILTLQKTFAGLTDEDVYFLLFDQYAKPNEDASVEEWGKYYDANFSFDINFCDTSMKYEGEADDRWMVKDEEGKSGIPLEDFTKPGTNETVTTGDHFKVYASKCLTNPSSADNLNNASNESNGATLEKNSQGDWVYTQTISIPTTPEDEATEGEGGYRYFYTVYELHGEVPGYAKLDPHSAVYTVQLNKQNNGSAYEHTWTGYGKFVQSNTNYTDIERENALVNMTDEDEQNGIANNELARLHITGDTTISFTNYYTDSLSIQKEVTENDATPAADSELLTELENKEYTVKIAPAHPGKLVTSSSTQGKNSRGPDWANKLAGETVTVERTNEDGETHSEPVTFNEGGEIILKLYRGEKVTLKDIPAINYEITEIVPEGQSSTFYDTTSYYLAGVYFTETYDSKVDNGPADDQYGTGENCTEPGKDNKGPDHWNQYSADDSYGYSDANAAAKKQDGVVSVDVEIGSAEPSVAVTLTNDYDHFKTVTITKQIGGEMGAKDNAFNFTTNVARNNEGASYDNDIQSITVVDGSMSLLNGEKTVGSVTVINSRTEEGAMNSSGYQLSHSDVLTIGKLKKGDTITIAETDANRNGYDTTYTINGAAEKTTYTEGITVTLDDTTLEAAKVDNIIPVVVYNDRPVVTPTGLESNHTKPYALMVGAGALAGLALVGGILARRARRRREW